MWLPETFHNESALSVQQSHESTKTGHDIKSSKTLFYFSACISTPSSGGDKRQPTVVGESVNIKWPQAPSHWSLPGWMGSVQARGKRRFINIHVWGHIEEWLFEWLLYGYLSSTSNQRDSCYFDVTSRAINTCLLVYSRGREPQLPLSGLECRGWEEKLFFLIMTYGVFLFQLGHVITIFWSKVFLDLNLQNVYNFAGCLPSALRYTLPFLTLRLVLEGWAFWNT